MASIRNRSFKIIFISFAVIVVLIAAFVYLTAKKLYTPTTGPRIARYNHPAKALLVIDVQEDYTGLRGGQPSIFKKPERVIATINALIEKASISGMKVVYIRQIFDNNFITRHLVGRTIEGLPGTELDSRVKVISRNDFTKKISDAFSNPKLDEFLVASHVDELYLVGLDGAYCVYYTAMGARNRGYKVTVIKDAILTRKNMDNLLEQYKKDGILTALCGEVLN